MKSPDDQSGALSDAPKRSNVVKVLHWGDSPARIICLIGSCKYQSEFLSAARAFSLRGDVVLTPNVYTQPNGTGLVKSEQDLLHDLTMKKIEMSDFVFVVNPNNKMTDSVRKEIAHAESLGRLVSYLETPNGS